jgi:pyrroloquinoline-quinone synthase
MHRLFDSIDAKLAERHMLRHPFYQAWSEGKLSKEILKAYACQYYHFVKEFPRMVSAVHTNTPDIKLRAPLLLNLMDEELGEENHPALWMRFAQAIGASTEEVETTSPLPGTAGLVATCRSARVLSGRACVPLRGTRFQKSLV